MPDRRSDLRGALHREDGTAVVAALARSGGGGDYVLQLAGDGLLIAVGQHVDGADRLAAACVDGLRRRGWDGDDLLAEQLAAALGSGPAPLLRRLAVDLDELSGILEGDPVHGGGRVDRHTGEVWHASAVEYVRETGEESVTEDPYRWLWVDSQGSWDSYRDMETFIGTVTNPARARRLDTASAGGGRSVGSRTPSPPGPTSWSAGTGGPRNAASAGPATGSPTPTTPPGTAHQTTAAGPTKSDAVDGLVAMRLLQPRTLNDRAAADTFVFVQSGRWAYEGLGRRTCLQGAGNPNKPVIKRLGVQRSLSRRG